MQQKVGCVNNTYVKLLFIIIIENLLYALSH